MFSSHSTPSPNRSPALHSTHSNRCHPERSEGSAFLFLLASCHLSLATAPLTPFPATLRAKSQLIENPAALSSFAATLKSRIKHKSIVCRSYRKHPGSHLSSPRSFRRGFSWPNFLPTRHSPLGTISSIIRTYIKSAHKLFRMNTSKKTRVGPLPFPHPCGLRPSNQAVLDTEDSQS